MNIRETAVVVDVVHILVYTNVLSKGLSNEPGANTFDSNIM